MLKNLLHPLLLFLILLQCVPLRACALQRLLTGENPCTGERSCEGWRSTQEAMNADDTAGFLPVETHSTTCEVQRPSFVSGRAMQDFSVTFISFEGESAVGRPICRPQRIATAFIVTSDPPPFSFLPPLLT